ncbi:ribosome silencing factor [Rhodoflexus caldus]|uniref:ribosome silencing factor n=1 Tax=Rhodoflexus caldus TaxID=2891236 RepID=UPI00202A22E7|nr:ribosome silencing factor [Rhodoflexus caldus]
MTQGIQAKKKQADAEMLSRIIAEGMLEKKGIDVVIMDLRKAKNAVTDFFVICSGNSDTQVEALMNSVEEQVHKHLGEWPWQKEGKANREWILLDYVNVVAHIFKKDRRQFYGLEELWGDAETIHVENSAFSPSHS